LACLFPQLGNALKYTQRGRIGVSLKSTRGEAVLTVSDTGVGIPQDELGKIFERFHRVQTSSKSTTMSTGIGLALTLELVKLIGGQLEVESELGKGSTFTYVPPSFTSVQSPGKRD
jgi:signal transduction histidine kinase